MTKKGALIYPSNDSRWYGAVYKINNKIAGYEKKREDIRGSNYCNYTIWQENGPDLKIYGPEKLNGSPAKAYDANDKKKELPGTLTRGVLKLPSGGIKMRPDSRAVFQEAARGMKQHYPGTVIKGFNNVHDDEKDGGSTWDTCASFFTSMNELTEECRDLDFFAYAGHGMPKALPSAGFGMTSKAWGNFVDRLRLILKRNARILFYACSCGAPGGICEALSREFPDAQVYGHRVPGHGQTNPDKLRYINGKGFSYKQEFTREEYRKWDDKLDLRGNGLWIRYAWMSFEQVRAEVNGEKFELIDLEGTGYQFAY